MRKPALSRRKVAPENEHLVIADYESGMPRKVLLAKWNCSRIVVKGILERNGKRLRTPAEGNKSPHKIQAIIDRCRVLTDEQCQAVADEYVNNPTRSASQIAEDYSTTEWVILHAIRRLGIPRREHTRKYSVNEAFFENAENNPVAAYVVGLLMTDGCVIIHKSGVGIVQLGLANDDGLHVKTIRNVIGATYPVNVQRQTRGIGTVSTLVIRSNKMADDLKHYGVVPRKTYEAKIHQSLAMNRDFWRGAVDGDGWCSHYEPEIGKTSAKVGLCGSVFLVRQFLEFARSVVSTHKVISQVNYNLWNLGFSGWSAIQIIRAMYANASIALPRKLENAKLVMDIYEALPSDGNCRLHRGVLMNTRNQYAATR